MLNARRTRWRRTRNPCINTHRNADTDFVDLCSFCVDSDEFKRSVVAEMRVGPVLLPGRHRHWVFVGIRSSSCKEELPIGSNGMEPWFPSWFPCRLVDSREENIPRVDSRLITVTLLYDIWSPCNYKNASIDDTAIMIILLTGLRYGSIYLEVRSMFTVYTLRSTLLRLMRDMGQPWPSETWISVP